MLNELKIDVDPGDPVYTLDHLVGLLRRAGKRLVWLRQERSRSGKGWHLTLKITPPCHSPMEVIALQAVCGSDRYREANNVLRARHVQDGTVSRYWRTRFNVFYDPTY